MRARSNWSGTYTFGASALHEPTSIGELQRLVAGARRVRVIGTRHSFTGIADSDELITLHRLPRAVELDLDASTVSVPAAITYADLAAALADHGLALHNTASLPHVSVGGAVATATHGSGDRNGNLATAVRGIEMVTGDGDIVRVTEGDPGFEGAVVHLGALGAITRLTLAVEPSYDVHQQVFEGLTWDAVDDHFDEVMASGDSVSLFTSWGDAVEQTWVKTRAGARPPGARAELFGAPGATTMRHPIAGLDPVDCTEQLGIAGPWSERLPHFRSGFRAGAGEEIQSEWHLPRQHARAAIRAVRGLGAIVGPELLVSEIRTVAADDLWMSPMYGRDTVCIHFTWRREPEPVYRAVAHVEEVLEPFEPRPHWGKVFLTRRARIAERYPRLVDFLGLAEGLDPRRVFRNDWFEEHISER